MSFCVKEVNKVPDLTIGQLPNASQVDPSSLFVAEQSGVAVNVTGAQLLKFANVETAAQVQAATEAAQSADQSAQKAENASLAIQDLGVSAETVPNTSPAEVQKTVDPTSGAVTLEFQIPAGAAGPAGKDGKSAYQDAAASGYTGTEADFNAALACLPSMWMLKGGIYIPSKSNLNDYTIPGNYYCNSNTTAKTLSNTPIAASSMPAFIMKVFYAIGTSSPAQMLITHSLGVDTPNYSFIREFLSTGQWGSWMKIGPITLSDLGITAKASELNYVSGVTSPLQTQILNRLLKNFQFSGAGGSAYTFAFKNNDASAFGSIGGYGTGGIGAWLFMGFGDEPWLPENALIVSPTVLKYKNKDVYHAGNPPKLENMGVTAKADELNYVSGVTSNIQEQLNAITAQIGDIAAQLDAINGEVV